MIFTGSLFQLSHIQFFFDNFRSAISGVEWFVAVYIVCILCFFIVGKQYLNTAFVYPLAFMAVTVFNPFLIVPLSEVIGLTTRIRRLFWLLPVNLVLAFSFTWLCTRPGRQLLKIGAAVCCIGFIVTAGTSVRPYLRMPQNIYKTSDIILEISGRCATSHQASNRRLLPPGALQVSFLPSPPQGQGDNGRPDIDNEWICK